MKLRTIALVFGLITLTACSKLSLENYDKLEMGMTKTEVERVLGSTDGCAKTMGTMTCTWGDEESKYVKIVFVGDKAITFNYDGLN